MARRSHHDSRVARPDESETDPDLLLGREDSLEDGDILGWIRALDLHVLGACRADERLNPLLKITAPTAPASGEDRLISHLAQYFEASEIGMLLRCLCVPLVSIRVGKVRKQATLLCPTNIRGHLNLTILPSSNMRISFCGDDGCNERVAVIPHCSGSFEEASVEEISADNSGRTFLLKLPDSQISYFWCSEKSKQHGVELLQKMTSLLRKRPALSQLTGICESRLDTFATHMRAYLLGSTNSSKIAPSSVLATNSCFREPDPSSQLACTTSKLYRSRPSASQPGKASPFYQGSLSPRSSTFKDGPSRGLSILRSGVKEKFRKRGDNSNLLVGSSLAVPTSLPDIHLPFNNRLTESKPKEDDNNPACGLPRLPSLMSSSLTSGSLPFHFPYSKIPVSNSPLLSPYYCWCPPCTSPLQHMSTPSILPFVGSDSSPLSAFSSAGTVSFRPSEAPCEQSQLSKIELPSTIPFSSYAAMSNSQQIPTFTPFMSDSIVHIPVIDVCSSGPGYLVSAGPALSSISPLLPNLVNPLTEAESIVENSARETLRVLMSSTPTSPQLMQVLPAVLTSSEESFASNHVKKHDIMVSGSRGLYTGVRDIDAIENGMRLIDFTSSRTGTSPCEDYSGRSEDNQDGREAERRVQSSSEGEEAKDSES